MSVCENVEGARVLTTMDVPRATSGQLGSGIWGHAVFEIIHVDVEYSRICVDLNSYNPFHWCAHYLIGSNPWEHSLFFLAGG